MPRWAMALTMACAACSRRATITSCDDDLRGVYVSGNERWMILDSGPTLEAYPLFPDGVITGDLVVAPRVIDLERAPGGAGARGDARPGDMRPALGVSANVAMHGVLHQRFMRRAERCDAQVPIEVTRCAGETLELVLADPVPPIGFTPCAWGQRGPSRIVRWQRE